MNNKLRSILSLLLAIVLMVGLIPESSASAAAKKMNKTKLHMWEGDTFQLNVNGAKGPFTWSSSARRYAYSDDNGLVTANRAGEADIIAVSKKGKTFKCHVTVEAPYFDYNPARLMVGQPRSLNFHGPEGTIFETNKPEVLSIDENGVATALSVAEDIVVTAICPSGRKVQCKLIAGYNVNDYEQANDEWGILHVNEKKYEWIPEVTYDHPKKSQIKQILIDAMLHGTDRIIFTNMKGEDIDEYRDAGLGQRADYCQDLFFDYAPFLDLISPLAESNNGYWEFQFAYDLGTRLMFSMTIEGYDLKKAIDDTKKAVSKNGAHVMFRQLYDYTYEDAVAVMDKIKPVVADILNDPTINTDMEVIKYVHDYICDIATYYKDAYQVVSYEHHQYWDVHGILLYGEGTCSSYASTMMLFLTYLGFRNDKQNNSSHVWNKVLLNKKYYHIDVQVDDSSAEGRIDSKNNIIDETGHNIRFFCIPDEQFASVSGDRPYNKSMYFYIR